MVRRVDSAGGTATDSRASDNSEATAETVLPGSENAAAVPEKAVVAEADASVDVLAVTGQGAQVVPSTQHAEFPVPSWDRYEFLSLIGRGGMGAVYKARDRRLERVVALKFLRIDDPSMVARFQREASTQARLEHPNICRVFEVGEVEHKPYIAMQFVDGKTLDQAARGLSLHEKVTLIKQVALALHEAHRLGIVHRDIKPSNIMVVRGADGTNLPLLMDFGIAHEAKENAGLTETGAVMGTPAYMSPEQARGGSRSVDRRADVYSLGATLYELLTGKPPFGGSEVVDVLLAVLNDEPRALRDVSPDVPRDLETVVLKCLAKDAGQRYDSARALSEDLQRYIDGEPILGRRVSLLFRLRRQYRKHKALFALSVVAVVTIAAITGVGVRERIRSQRQVELAQRLGSEVKDMEWLLRTARGMPVHDINREKKIVRARMAALQSEFSKFGPGGRALAHYALGRGYMGLHEYGEALRELNLSIAQGYVSGDVHYALGIVLGKHYEQARREVRMSGGGAWAKKRMEGIEQKFLQPAIAELNSSKKENVSSTEYLDALISYYKKEYSLASSLAMESKNKTPWLYESIKIQGDVHLEQALENRDSGKYIDAEREFDMAIKSFTEASEIGASDGEVYDGLAEAWIRKTEMLTDQGRSIGGAYEFALTAGEKITVIEPQSIDGHLKIAFAAAKTMNLVGGKMSSSDRVNRCLAEVKAVLDIEPHHPYARELGALCHMFSAELAQGRGEDPEDFLRKALELLLSTVEDHPQFLWGLNDLSTAYAVFGMHLQVKGKPEATQSFQSALNYANKAAALDDTYLTPIQNSLYVLARLSLNAQSIEIINQNITNGDALYAACMKVNNKHQQCTVNYLTLYTIIAERLKERNSEKLIRKAIEIHRRLEEMEGSFFDADQYAALAYFLDASSKQKMGGSSAQGTEKAILALKRCLAKSAKDPMCLTIATQIEWLQASQQRTERERIASLLIAKAKAEEATQSLEVYPDAWQVLAESNLRLARESKEPLRNQYVQAGHAALAKAFAINPNHAKGRATEGVLLLLAAEDAKGTNKRELAQAALSALEKSATLDPLAAPVLSVEQARARALAALN